MSKESDEKCLNCINYDTCDKPSSKNCDNYTFYNCKTCIDKVIENDYIPRCFRNGVPCTQIKFCNNYRENSKGSV